MGVDRRGVDACLSVRARWCLNDCLGALAVRGGGALKQSWLCPSQNALPPTLQHARCPGKALLLPLRDGWAAVASRDGGKLRFCQSKSAMCPALPFGTTLQADWFQASRCLGATRKQQRHLQCCRQTLCSIVHEAQSSVAHVPHAQRKNRTVAEAVRTQEPLGVGLQEVVISWFRAVCCGRCSRRVAQKRHKSRGARPCRTRCIGRW